MDAPNRFTNLQTLRYSNWDVAFATAFITLTTGVFLVGFVQHLGGSDLWIGLLSSLPSLFGLLYIPGAIWGRSFASFKRFVTPGGWVWRAGHLPLIFLPFLSIPNEAKLVVLTLSIGIAYGAIALVNPIYSDWLAEMVPSSSRGFYFSRRNAISAGVGAVVGIVGAVLLDTFRSRGEANLGFSVVFGLGWGCSLVSMFFFLRMRDIPRPNPVRQDLRQAIRAFGAPLGDREFRAVITFLALFVTGQVFAGPLFAAFALESLKLDFKIVQGAVFMHAIGNVLTSRFWGFLSDRFGNKPILTLSGYLMALNLIPWVICQPGRDTFNTVILLSSHVLLGATWSAIALCQLNLVLATAKEEDRANYLGTALAVQTLVGGVAPMLGAATMSLFRLSMPAEHAYKTVFAITAVIRVLAMQFLRPVKEEGASGFWDTWKNVRTMTPKGVKAMRSLKASTDARARAAAIQNVGEQGMSMAAEEVIKALHDPQPRVRRRAATALAELKDRRATEALLHMLAEHPDLVEEETVEALGQLQDPTSVPTLIGLLEHPSSLIRRAAARALGRMRAKEAIPVLVRCAQREDDLDLRRSALQSLRLMEARSASDVIARAMEDPHPSVRVAAAEAIAELELKEAADEVRRSLSRYDDEASSEAVYALGTVGDLSDLPTVMERASRCTSIITRRRCLLAAARLLGVEREAYRLMLLEGIARDEELMALAARSPHSTQLRKALSRVAAGDEAAATRMLVDLDERLAPLAWFPAEEAFLVAVAALTAVH
jgi:HEAT repeat protein/MFS family permease